jgi:RNA polymerase sigma-70 factor (ECF subfamily)
MPPQPFEYHGRAAIASFLRHRHGAPIRVAPIRANTQPAFGCYLPVPSSGVALPYGLLVLTLDDGGVSAATWFSDTAVFPRFGLPGQIQAR